MQLNVSYKWTPIRGLACLAHKHKNTQNTQTLGHVFKLCTHFLKGQETAGRKELCGVCHTLYVCETGQSRRLFWCCSGVELPLALYIWIHDVFWTVYQAEEVWPHALKAFPVLSHTVDSWEWLMYFCLFEVGKNQRALYLCSQVFCIFLLRYVTNSACSTLLSSSAKI